MRRSGSNADVIDPIGYLDLYLTFSGFRILPAVARIAPDYALQLNRVGSRRRVRSAARISDDAGKSSASFARDIAA